MTLTRYAATTRLRPEMEAEYCRLHEAVWPAVLARIQQCNIINYSIFLFDGCLFSYLEYVGTDYDADMAAMAADETTQRWWVLTGPCQQPLGDAEGSHPWSAMTEVFHVD